MSDKRDRFSKLAASKSKEETKSKGAKKTLISGKQTTEDEANAHVENETFNNADTKTETDQQNETKEQEETQLELNQQTQTDKSTQNDDDVKLFNDPAMELIQVMAGEKEKKKKLEDERIRATYWVMPEHRKMVNKIAAETGYTKYDVVCAAIESMYDKVMEAKKERQDKKKKKPTTKGE